MLTRRNVLKSGLFSLAPFAFVKSLFAGEKIENKEKSKILFYKVDGVEIEQTTFFYSKEDLPPDSKNAYSIFFDENGNTIKEYGYNISKNPNLYIPENAVHPKTEWINKSVLEIIKYDISHKNITKLFVYIILREDSPEVGVLTNIFPYTFNRRKAV